MKKCNNCGAIQSDNHSNCIDCGNCLGPPLSKREEDEVNSQVAKKIKKLSNKSDYFYVSKLDKVVGALLVTGLVIALLVRIFGSAALIEADKAILLLAVLLMTIAAFDLLFPFISWELYKLKFIFFVDNYEDIQPSVIILYMRRIIGYGIFVIGYIYLISLLVRYIL